MKKKELEGSEDVKTDTKIEGGNTNVDLKDEDTKDPAPDVSVDLSELLTETDTRKVKEHRDANGALTGYTVTRRYRGAVYHIAVDNTAAVQHGVQSITVDGKALAGNVLPLAAAGTTVQVRVTMD